MLGEAVGTVANDKLDDKGNGKGGTKTPAQKKKTEYIVGGLALVVVAYYLYKKNQAANAANATNPAPTTSQPTPNGSGQGSQPYGGGGGDGYGGGGYGPGGPYPPQPGPTPYRPGSTWGSPCPGFPPQWIPKGAIYNCPNEGSKTLTSHPIATTTPTKTSTTSTPKTVAQAAQPTVKTTAQAQPAPKQSTEAQKSLDQAVTNVTTTGTPVTTSNGQTTTTGAIAYNNLRSQGYSQEAALAAAQQIAAANSGVKAGTPQLVAGTPVIAGSSSSTSTIDPAIGYVPSAIHPYAPAPVVQSNGYTNPGNFTEAEAQAHPMFWCGRKGTFLPIGSEC
jgi:hypothetical protein